MVPIIVGLSILALIVLWAVLVFRGWGTPPQPDRNAASYRHQHHENPDWFPGHGGGGGGAGGGV